LKKLRDFCTLLHPILENKRNSSLFDWQELFQIKADDPPVTDIQYDKDTEGINYSDFILIIS